MEKQLPSKSNKKNLFKALSILYFVFVALYFLDVFLLGSGNIGKFFNGSNISIRMILFVVVSIFSIVGFFVNKTFKHLCKWDFIWLFFIFAILYGLILGLILGNEKDHILHDIKKFIPLFIIPMIKFSGLIENKNQGHLAWKIAEYSSLIISIFCITIYFSEMTNSIGFYSFFHDLLPRYEIIKRATNGGIYMPSQTVVFVVLLIQTYRFFSSNEINVRKLLLLFINFLCIAQSGTRSFTIPFIILIAYCLIVVIKRAKNSDDKKTIINVFLLLVITLFIAILIRTGSIIRFFSNNEPGTGKRSGYLAEIFQSSIFLGKGFGSSLNATGTSDLEIPIIEILYEQGIILALVWLGIGTLFSIYLFKKDKSLAFAFVLFFIANLANPYLTNPIGWSLISLLYFYSFCPKLI